MTARNHKNQHCQWYKICLLNVIEEFQHSLTPPFGVTFRSHHTILSKAVLLWVYSIKPNIDTVLYNQILYHLVLICRKWAKNVFFKIKISSECDNWRMATIFIKETFQFRGMSLSRMCIWSRDREAYMSLKSLNFVWSLRISHPIFPFVMSPPVEQKIPGFTIVSLDFSVISLKSINTAAAEFRGMANARVACKT